MKFSLSWLKEFVEVPVAPKELARDLTMLGLNVEAVGEAGDDRIFDVEVTSNRPDCLSHLGIAREVATRYGKPLKRPPSSVAESSARAADEITIEIPDADLCARYCGRVVRRVEVKPSPDWLRRRLEALGQRPINNVADITNYVLLELGHPLHAFDRAKIRQKKILVRRARPGERLRTLDGFDRTLTAEDLVIADGERPVALAGVMGGEDSEISASTREVLLESAWFEPAAIRRTAKAQGMRTEASYRFERGADIEMARTAIDRAAALIAELAGGEVLAGVVDVYPRKIPRAPIPLRQREIARILGAEISGEEVERILRGLEFGVEASGAEGWRVVPPSFRPDVLREVDLLEEVARHYGYDRLPSRLRPAPPRLESDPLREKEHQVTDILTALGYREIIPTSLISPQENARFTDRPPVELANPLSADASVLRSTAVPSLVRALKWNLDRARDDVRLFETGKTYTPAGGELPREDRVLTLGLTGRRRAKSVHDDEARAGFFDLKGDLETLLEAFELPGLTFEPKGCAYFEAGRAGQFVIEAGTLARFGQLRSNLEREYKLRQPVFVAEVDLDRLLAAPLRSRTFKPFSKFPAVERDFSLVVPEGVSYAMLEQAVRGAGIAELQSVRPVDRFTGSTLPPGTYSLLLRVTFQSQDRTLTSEKADEFSRRLVESLAALGVRLRG